MSATNYRSSAPTRGFQNRSPSEDSFTTSPAAFSEKATHPTAVPNLGFCWRLPYWKLDGYRGAVGLQVFHIDTAVVFAHRAVTNAQAQPRSLPNRPRTVERIERAAKVVEPRPRIGEPHDNFFAFLVPLHQDFLFFRFFQGLNRCAEYIPEPLFHLS